MNIGHQKAVAFVLMSLIMYLSNSVSLEIDFEYQSETYVTLPSCEYASVIMNLYVQLN